MSLGEAHTRFAEKLREFSERVKQSIDFGRREGSSRISDYPRSRGTSSEKPRLIFPNQTASSQCNCSYFCEKIERLLTDLEAQKIREKTRVALEGGLEFKGETSTSFAKISALKRALPVDSKQIRATRSAASASR